MANRDDEATERFVKAAQGSYQAAVAHTIGLQERNVRFAQGLVEGSIRGLHRQSERNWEMAEELAKRAEERSDAFRTLIEESVYAYVDLLCMPFSYHGKCSEVAR